MGVLSKRSELSRALPARTIYVKTSATDESALREFGCDVSYVGDNTASGDPRQRQTLDWIADSDFKLHIYGKGWEDDAALARFWRGAIQNSAAARSIAQASKINLHIGHSMDARLIDGMTAGGFFLARFSSHHLLERFYQPLWSFICENDISTPAELRERATPGINRLIDFANRSASCDVLASQTFFQDMRESAAAGFARSPATALWPEYCSIAFDSRDELIGLISRFLYDEPERRGLAESMRRRIIDPIVRVSVSRKVLANSDREVAA